MGREYRVKRPELGVHAVQLLIVRAGVAVPRTIAQVWRNEPATPPGTMVRIPSYALRDLAAGRCVP